MALLGVHSFLFLGEMFGKKREWQQARTEERDALKKRLKENKKNNPTLCKHTHSTELNSRIAIDFACSGDKYDLS